MPTLQLSSLELPFSFPRISSDFLATYRIILALTLSIFVLATLVRVFLFPSKRSKKQVVIVCTKATQSAETVPKEKPLSQSVDQGTASSTTSVTTTTIAASNSKWSLGWLTWQRLPALPVSFAIPDNQNRVIGQGVGLMNTITRVPSPVSAALPPPPSASSSRQQQQQNLVQSLRRGTPVFDRPLPSIYQTQVPISMAKIIMSRHTLRRPSGVRPPPPTNSSTPVNSSSRRHTSAMV